MHLSSIFMTLHSTSSLENRWMNEWIAAIAMDQINQASQSDV